jgi:glycosyltransferase involved in cell wall biosynthesis
VTGPVPGLGRSDVPPAHYLILASRLVPGLDGGFTVATLQRAQLLRDLGAQPRLLTLDPATPDVHAAHRETFVERGDAASIEVFRNLFDDAVAEPGWLTDAAQAGEADPDAEYRVIADATGRPVLSIPVIPGDADWHLTTVPVVVHTGDGDRVLDGFGGLYRAWLDHVVSALRAAEDKPVVLICESRQLGELLAHWRPEGVRIVHTIHIAHVLAPYTPDAPVNALWERWFRVADRFDAVMWPTPQQKRDVEDRFGVHDGYVLAANAAPEIVAEAPAVDGKRLVMLNRLAPVKRVDHAIRAWSRVAAVVPDATLEIWGDGVLRADLERLIDDLGLSASVVLRGRNDAGPVVFDGAVAMVQSSAYEGQGLSTLEAMTRGCPVIAYDVPYGPRDQLEEGAGILVPDPGGEGDVDALAAAMIRVLTDADARARMSCKALETARRFAPAVAASALAAAVRHALR